MPLWCNKLSGAHENIVDNFGHVHGCSVIDAIPLRNSPTILVFGTIACKRATNRPSARRIFAAEREKLRRSNLLDFDGRAWTTNCHRDRTALSAHKVAPERATAQDSLASRQMSETQNDNYWMTIQLLNPIAAILTAGRPNDMGMCTASD